MALPDQQFRFSGVQALSINDDPENVLDDIADWLNSATVYYDAASRTAGAGSAWTATKEVSGVTVAARLQPPSTGGAPNQRVVIAAVGAGAPTPAMLASDTFAVDRFLIGHVKEVDTGDEGDYVSWDNASTPYTGSNFTGYARCGQDLGAGTFAAFAIFAALVSLVSTCTNIANKIIESVARVSVLFKTNARLLVCGALLLLGAVGVFLDIVKV